MAFNIQQAADSVLGRGTLTPQRNFFDLTALGEGEDVTEFYRRTQDLRKRELEGSEYLRDINRNRFAAQEAQRKLAVSDLEAEAIPALRELDEYSPDAFEQLAVYEQLAVDSPAINNILNRKLKNRQDYASQINTISTAAAMSGMDEMGINDTLNMAEPYLRSKDHASLAPMMSRLIAKGNIRQAEQQSKIIEDRQRRLDDEDRAYRTQAAKTAAESKATSDAIKRQEDLFDQATRRAFDREQKQLDLVIGRQKELDRASRDYEEDLSEISVEISDGVKEMFPDFKAPVSGSARWQPDALGEGMIKQAISQSLLNANASWDGENWKFKYTGVKNMNADEQEQREASSNELANKFFEVAATTSNVEAFKSAIKKALEGEDDDALSGMGLDEDFLSVVLGLGEKRSSRELDEYLEGLFGEIKAIRKLIARKKVFGTNFPEYSRVGVDEVDVADDNSSTVQQNISQGRRRNVANYLDTMMNLNR